MSNSALTLANKKHNGKSVITLHLIILCNYRFKTFRTREDDTLQLMRHLLCQWRAHSRHFQVIVHNKQNKQKKKKIPSTRVSHSSKQLSSAQLLVSLSRYSQHSNKMIALHILVCTQDQNDALITDLGVMSSQHMVNISKKQTSFPRLENFHQC